MACHGNASTAGFSCCCSCSDNGKCMCCACVQAGRCCFSCVPLKKGRCRNCGRVNADSAGSESS